MTAPSARRAGLVLIGALAVVSSGAARAQEPASWGARMAFHTFSIAAVDPRTGEVGVGVTTRAACVGNGVPWVRAGVGAVATQADTRTDYGPLLLDRLQAGEGPAEALQAALRADPAADSRQVAVIALDGRGAQHTGGKAPAWSGQARGATYVVQGNTLAGPQVLDAVAASFEASGAQPRHLADRLIAAIAAGDAAGGDRRRGRMQSAAVIVADPRPGHARRPDKVSTFIDVCEHPDPVGELRRVYDAISETLGYRTLQVFEGRDVAQLRIMLQALGYLPAAAAGGYTPDLAAAVDAFRAAEGLADAEAPAGYVDRDTVQRLWAALARAGKEEAVRRRLLDATQVTR